MTLARRLLDAVTGAQRARARLQLMQAELHTLADELHQALDDRDISSLRRAVDDHVRELRVIATLGPEMPP